MFKRVVIIVALLIVAGCGYNPEKPVYDTAKNPQGFPQQALDLITGVENRSLATYDQITGAFADLYTEHSELLDNEEWRKVIDRLGEKFRYRADQAVEKGPAGYTEAAALYQLASFARPSDKHAHEAARLFATWAEMEADSATAVRFAADSRGPSLEQKIRLLRQFETGDSLHQAFADEYLKYQLFEGMLVSGRLSDSMVGRLDRPDRVFLSYEGLTELGTTKVLSHFERPSIDLLAASLVPLKPGWYRLELYWLPQEKITRNLTVAVRIPATDTSTAGAADTASGALSFDFDPATPTSQWLPNKIRVVAKRIYTDSLPSEVRVGLYQRPSSPPEFVPIEGTDKTLVTLSTATILDD